MTEIRLKHNEKQKQALITLLDQSNGVSELLFGGAAGGGKSWIGCEWLVYMSQKYAGTRWLMGRSRLKDLLGSTFNSFKDVTKHMGMIQGVDWKFNGQYNIVTFPNGSEIVLRDLFQYPSDPDFNSLGGLEITGAFIDEVNQCTLKAKDVVKSRIRYKLDEYGLVPKLFMTCNPSKNWVYNDYYKPHIDGSIFEYRRFIQSLVSDNKEFISVHYVTNLRQMSDKANRSRLLEGSWEYSDELSMFDFISIQETLSRKKRLKKGLRYFMAVDVARLGKDKTVIAICSEDRVIVQLIEIDKCRTTDLIRRIKRLQLRYEIDEYDIAIDSDGVGGGVADAFENAVHIVNNSRALFDENYYNIKTQLYFKLAELFNDGELCFNSITDEQAEKIAQELQILRREKIELDGKVCMTSKAQIKKQINRSPDYSDTLAYLMYFFLEEFDDGVAAF